MLTRRPSAGWLEVHAENYMGDSAGVAALEKLRQTYPLSVHGVGLSLGSANGLDRDHLKRLRQRRASASSPIWSPSISPGASPTAPISTICCRCATTRRRWRSSPATSSCMQDTLKRRILIENLSAYVDFADSTMTEAEFLAELVKRTGCGLLLDVNNVYVSAHNLGFDAGRFIDTLPAEAIGEIHLAGHAVNEVGDDTVLIDDHGSRVPPAVWSLYADAIRKFGPRPTLIEWDTDVPVARRAARRGDVGGHARRFDRVRPPDDHVGTGNEANGATDTASCSLSSPGPRGPACRSLPLSRRSGRAVSRPPVESGRNGHAVA